MANAFNLTAQINLQGPTNIKNVVAGIKKELGTINTDVNLKIDNKSVNSVKKITSELKLMNNVLVSASSNAANLNKSFSSLANALGRASQASKTINTGLNQSSKTLRDVSSASKQAANSIDALGKNARSTAKRFLIYTAVTRVFYGFTNAIDGAFRRYVEFDKQLIRLQQVTKSGSIGISGIAKEIDKLAVSLGVSTEKLTETSVTLAQAGFTAEETRAALSALAKTELAPTFDDITRTTEGAIAAIRQFELETTQLESILGSINAVSARFAVESGDIIAAIQRTGGVFASASKGVKNLDGSLKTGEQALQEFTAVFTSVRASTRESAETIATGLRTIFTRIQRGSTIEYLKQFNIELQDLEGNFVGPYEAVRRLSAGLKDLDPRDVRFNRIVEELGGFRQIGKVIPLLQNFAEAERALATAQSGTQSLEGDRIKGLQSLANQLSRVNEQAFSLFKTIGDSKVFRGFLSVVLSLTSGLLSLAKTFQPLLPFLAILGTIKIAKSAFNFASGAAGAIKAGGGAKGVGAGIGRSLTGTTDNKKDQSLGAITQNTSALKSLTNAVLNLTNRMNRTPGGGPRGFASGGIVPGSGNRDTVPAMLTPGEFVIRKKAVETIGAGNLYKMNKYANGGGIKDEDTVGALILEYEKGGIKDYDISKESLLSAAGSNSTTKQDIRDREKGYNVKMSSFGDQQTYKTFNDAINHGIISGVNATVKELIEKFKDVQIFGISMQNGAEAIRKSFYDSINQGTRGNMFEDVLQASVARGKEFKGGPQDFWDFTSGIGSMTKYFSGLDKVKYIDGRASASEALSSDIIPKIINQLGLENKTVDDPNKQTLQPSDILSRIRDYLQQNGPTNRPDIISALNLSTSNNKSSLSRKAIDIEKFSNFSDYIEVVNPGQNLALKWQARALGGFIQKFAEGGESKKQKDFGQIILSNGSSSIISRYNPNSTRTGFVKAKKWKDGIWTVGLSQASKGYGPKLYDVAMEGVTELGGMLTSDRATVSGDAKKVWEYYFKNRPDVQKTPLPRDAWTGNYAMIDEKLRGPEDTWPPKDDPAWTLQTGYRKSPSLINDPNLVKRISGGESASSTASMALSYFSRYANGGTAEDTVPALLTPGEFVINKKAAARIGASNLHRMNRADKIQGYNSGGSVGFIQRFAGGGGVDDPLVLDVYKDAAEKAGQTLEEFSRSLKEASKQIFEQNKQRIKETRADLKTNIIRTRSAGFGSEDDVQNFQRDLGAQLAGILGDNISGERLQDALDEIAIGLMDNKSLPELIKTIPELASAFDEGADSYRANFRVQKELEAEFGGLINAVKLSAKDLAEIEWRKSDEAKGLGGVGKAADIAQSFGFGGGAYAFAQSETGQKIVALQKKYDNFGKTLVTRLGGVSPKLGQLAGRLGGFAKVLGGMPAVVSAAAGVLSDQLLPSLISAAGLSGTATGAGIQEAARQGSSQATAFAAIGNAILPGIGGLVMGIAGAISGALNGFIQGFRTKKLENSINKLNGTMKQVDRTFADYEAVQSQENLDRIYQSVADANVASMALEEQGRFTQGDRLRQGASGAINAGALAGGAAAILAVAGVLTGGAALAIAGTAAAVYGLFSYLTAVPDELDNQALEAYLGNLGEFNKAITGLARIELKKQTVEQLDRALEAIESGDFSGSAIVEAGKKAGLSETDVFRRAAQQRIYEESGGNIDLYRRTVSDLGGEDSPELIEKGKAIVKQQEEQLTNEAKQANLLRDINIEVENILDEFQKLNAVIKRVGSDLDELDKSIEDQMSTLRGEGRVREAGRRDINILQNARGYSAEEVRGAAARAGRIIGGERGREVQSAVESKRILDEELPKILQTASSQNIDEVIGKIDQALAAGSIDRGKANEITEQLEKSLESRIGSRVGIGLDELAEDVPALVASMKALDEQNKAAISASELFAKALDQSTKYANEYIKALDAARERELAGIQSKIEGENRIAQALGKRLTVEQKTASFFAEFDSLSPGMREGGQIDIAEVIAERERTRRQITSLEDQKANTDPQNTAALISLQEKLAELNATDANLIKSLEYVANSNELLEAAISSYQERIQKEDKQLGFLDQILTGIPQDIAQMSTDLNAFNVALAGDPRARQVMFSTTEGRESALRGSQMALDLFGADDAQSRRIQAQLRLGMLEGMGPEMQRIINQEIPGMNGEMTTLKKILEQRALGEPTLEEQQAVQAIELQQAANSYLAGLAGQNAQAMKDNIGVPLKRAIKELPAAIAEALRGTPAASAMAGTAGTVGAAGTAGAGGGAGTGGTMGGGGVSASVGDTSIPLTPETESALTTAQTEVMAFREERTSITDAINKLKELDKKAYSTENEAAIREIATKMGYTKGKFGGYFNPSGEGIGGAEGVIEDLISRYLKTSQNQEYLAAERRLVEAEQRAKTEREAAAAFLPPDNPYKVPEYKGPADLTIPRFPGMDTSLATDTSPQIGLGGLDISGLLTTLGNVDSSLQSLTSAFNLSTTAFEQIKSYLDSYTVPLVLDEQSISSLTSFNTDFGKYVKQLSNINLPDTITINAKHTVTVDVRGAEVFAQLDEGLQRTVVAEVNRQLNRQTDGALGSSYQA